MTPTNLVICQRHERCDLKQGCEHSVPHVYVPYSDDNYNSCDYICPEAEAQGDLNDCVESEVKCLNYDKCDNFKNTIKCPEECGVKKLI